MDHSESEMKKALTFSGRMNVCAVTVWQYVKLLSPVRSIPQIKMPKMTPHTRAASIPSPEKRDVRAECLTFVLTRFN